MIQRSFINAALTGGMCLILLAVYGFAQQAVQPNAPVQRRDAVQQHKATDRAAAGQLDDKTTGTNIRASQLMGMNIQNAKGESVGEINDIVLDARSGRVRYAAVTYGGLLGIGDKLFAVPFEALNCRRDPDDADSHILVLNVTQSQLEGVQGFDQDHWPNFADRKFTSDIDRQYGIERRMRNRDGNVDVNVSPNGVEIGIDSQQPNGTR